MKQIPLHSIVVLVGPYKGGKTTWAHSEFASHEIVSSDDIRLRLTGDRDHTGHSPEIWDELFRQVELKIRMGQRAVVDSTNLKTRDRNPFVSLGKKYGVEVFFVPIDKPLEVKRSLVGNDRDALAHVERTHSLWQSSKGELLKPIDGVTVASTEWSAVPHPNRMWQPHQLLAVGDVHGNAEAMTRALEYATANDLKIIWLGDVVDYGAHNLKAFRMAYDTVRLGQAAMIWGNHERKLDRWITSNWGQSFTGRISDATQATISEIQRINLDRRLRFESAWNGLRSWSWQHVKSGSWMFTHGAATKEMWDLEGRRLSGASGNHAFFGEVDNQDPTKLDGYPNRVWNWVNNVPAQHSVVVGHDWLDRATNKITLKTNPHGGQVFCVDCGSSKGGRLAALRINTQDNSYESLYFD